MKIFLWWGDEFGGVLEPHTSDLGAPAGDTLYIVSLLTDDGGFGFKKTIDESSDTLEAIKKIRAGLKESYSWNRETFCAEIFFDHVKISSQYLEDYFDVMELDEFESVLRAWHEMLVAGPRGGSSKIEIDIHPKLERPSA